MLKSLIEIMNNAVINVSRVLAILFITVFSITINAAVSIFIIIITSHQHYFHCHHDFHLS